MIRSWSASGTCTRCAVVGSNSFSTTAPDSASPVSQITTSASRSKETEGPNMGWIEATRPPAFCRARIGSSSGVLMLAMSHTTPCGGGFAHWR